MKTMHPVIDHRYAPLFKKFAEDGLDTQFDESARYVGNVLIDEDGKVEVLFVVVLKDWTTHSVEASAVSDGSNRPKISREYMFHLYDYVFNFAGKSCMYSLVKRDNFKSLKLQKSAGLKESGVLESFYGPDKDAVIFGITKQQWLAGKWSSPNSKRITT